MKRYFFVYLIFLFIVVNLFSNPVDSFTARNTAFQWLSNSVSSDKNLYIDEVKPIIKNDVTLWYLITLKPQGFILISADDSAYPVLGYSYKHNFEYPIKSPEVKYWMGIYEKELKYIISNRIDNKSTIKFWKSIENGDLSFAKSDRDVSPLTQTLWNQGQYYNEQCPYDASSSAGNNHVWAGCVATAMAQVMKFWSYPSHGTGSHSYNEDDYGTQSADFGATTYNWSAMPNSPSSVINDVTTLLYHLGVSVEMDYGPDGSGAWLSDAVSSLKTYFDYNSDAQMVWKSDYSTTDWENLLKADLDLGRPILYRGQGSGGHAFVCDGYEGTNHFHFNWGWSGSANGYYYLNNLNPNGHNYSDYQGAGIHIYPNSSGSFPAPTNLTATFSTDRINLSWDAPSRALSSYKIYRNGSYLASTTSTNYSDTAISAGHRYTYYVTAVYTSPDGESANSNTAYSAYPLDLPYSTTFNNTDGWWQDNTNCSDRWASSSSSNAGGSSPEFKASWEDADPATSRLVSPPLKTQNLETLTLNFKHFYDYFSSSGIAIKIQSSSDGENWTDETWQYINPSSNIGPEDVTTTITHNLGDITYIAWVITGNLYNFDYWYLDNVNITTPPPALSYTPASLNFGNVEINTSSVLQFTISNTGDNPLSGDITTPSDFSVAEVTRDGSTIKKALRNTLSYTIGKGNSKTYNVTFSPTAENTYTGNIQITSNDPNNSSATISVQGVGVAADISYSPSSYSISMEANTTKDKILTLTNQGQADLNYSISAHSTTYRTTITVYPQNANDWTGTTDGNTKLEHSLVKGYNNQDGWMKFDVSSIPDGVTINSIEFHGYVNATYWPYWSITPLSVDPVTATASELYSDINGEIDSGYYLHSNESQSFATGWHVYTLVGNANQDLQNALSSDYFAMGIASRDNSTQYYIYFDGWNETNRPYLVVDYTIEVPWIRINNSYFYSGTVSQGNNQDLTITFDTAGMSNGSYTANLVINSNDPDENPVTIPVSLSVENLPIISVSPTTLNYGDVYVGSPVTMQFTIQNTGHAVLNGDIQLINGYHLSLPSKDEDYHYSISPMSSQTFDLQCDPQSSGSYNGTIVITSNDNDNPTKEISVTANGLYHAIMTVNKDSLYFGNVLLGEYVSKTFTITNNGDENLTGVITPIEEYYVQENTSRQKKDNPAIRDTLHFNIPSHQSKEYIVYFYPNVTGEKSGNITFTSNDPYNNPPQIAVYGIGYLNPPQNVTISIENDNVKLNWDYDSRVSTYHVYASERADGGFVEIGTIPRPPFTILNGTTDTKKFYKVTAE